MIFDDDERHLNRFPLGRYITRSRAWLSFAPTEDATAAHIYKSCMTDQWTERGYVAKPNEHFVPWMNQLAEIRNLPQTGAHA